MGTYGRFFFVIEMKFVVQGHLIKRKKCRLMKAMFQQEFEYLRHKVYIYVCIFVTNKIDILILLIAFIMMFIIRLL